MATGEFKRRWLPLSDRFYRVAFYILESREEALDAVQDLYAKLWKMGPALDSVLNPEAYGLALLKNMCMDRVRHSRVAAADPIDGGEDVEHRSGVFRKGDAPDSGGDDRPAAGKAADRDEDEGV